MSSAQKQRWQKAQSATAPIEIVTLDEAKKAEKNKSKERKPGSLKPMMCVTSRAWDLPVNLYGMPCHRLSPRTIIR